jgi:hypothetical protein
MGSSLESAVGGIDARVCKDDPACVDVISPRHAEPWHMPADEFAAFVARVKAGTYDPLLPG